MAVFPLQNDPTPCSAETLVKQFTIPVYLGISPETILGFASCVWIKSLTRSIGAVAVFAIEPETPPAAKSLKKPSGSCLLRVFVIEREKNWVKNVQAVREKKKEKKEIRSLSDDDDVLLLAGDLSFSSEIPTRENERGRSGRKRDVDLSLFHLISFERDLLEKRVNI